MLEEFSPAAKSDSSAVESNALNSLRQEIAAHEKDSQSRSYLGKISDFVYRGDENSLAAMQKLQADMEEANRTGDKAKLAQLSGTVAQTVQNDLDKRKWQDEITHYSSGFLKTAAIFARGRAGLIGAIGAYALDAMNPSTDFRTQLIDGTLGGVKGGLLKGTFEFLGSKQVGVAAQGVALGASSRLLEQGLSRKTYEGANGQFNLAYGLGNTLRGTLDTKAMLSDVVVFGLAHGMLSKTNSLTGGFVEKSPALRTVLTGTTFGLATGSTNEIARQSAAGEGFDLGKVVKRSLLEGALDSLAAGPGGMQARSAAALRPADLTVAGDRTANPADLTARDGKTPREFMVVKGQEVIEALGAGTESSGWLRVREILGKGGESPLGPVKNLFVQHLGKGQAVNESAMSTADLVAFCHPESAPADIRGKHVLPEASGSVWLTPNEAATRIAFTAGDKPTELGEPYKADAVELKAKSALDVLTEKGHADYAELLRQFPKLRSLRAASDLVWHGNESVAIELASSKEFPDGGVLKISVPEGGWESAWGKRPFDAKILSKLYEVDMGSAGTAYAMVQELVKTMDRYDPLLLHQFMDKVAGSGLEFADPGADPNKQIGLSDRSGQLVLIDYSAVDRPGANETHQTIIGGSERVEAQYEAEDRLDFKEETDNPENVYETVVDGSLEARRQAALADKRLLPHQRAMLQELFDGSSLEDAALLRAVELGKMTPKGGLDMKQALAEARAVRDSARKAGLLPK